MKKAFVIVLGLLAFALYISIDACNHKLKDLCEGNLSIYSIEKTAAITGRSDATMTVSASGGTGIKYSISDTTFQDNGVFNNLSAKDYVITVKNSTGCMERRRVTIDSMSDPCLGVTVAISTTKTDANAGQSNGTITASATGSTDFTYQINGGAFQASGNFTGLATGAYTIAAKSGIGCIGTAQVSIGTINPCAGVTVTVTGTITHPVTGQSNGSITASATGGTGFTYSINGGTTYQASGTFSNLAAGPYTITAKSSAGCVGSGSFTLVGTNACAGVTITVTGTSTNPSTSSATNGTITASATGSTGLTYSLNGGTYQASGTFTNLGVGPYTVTAKNANGCTGNKQFPLIDNCTTYAINVTPTVTNAIPCSNPANNGSIVVSATGSTGFTYSFNGGSTYSATNTISNLANGASYNIVVKDGPGCTKAATATVALQSMGTLFTTVNTIVTTKCYSASCHKNNPGSASEPYFGDPCNIVLYASRIQIRITAGTMPITSVPALPALTATDKTNISSWIAAGGTYNK